MSNSHDRSGRMIRGAPPEATLDGLRERIRVTLYDVLARSIPECAAYALLDFPNHSNVGDSSIWLGELEYLNQRFKKKPVYTCDVKNFCARDLRSVLVDGPIFLHGGGNLGDWWPRYQELRERIISMFPEHPIIQLPQTIDFRDARNLERFRAVVANHRDVTILARERQSYDLAADKFDCKVQLCPDMAFSLGSLKRTPASIHCLWLLRTDYESRLSEMAREQVLQKVGEHTLPSDHAITDWLVEDRSGWLRVHDKFKRWLRRHPRLLQSASSPGRSLIYQKMARQRVRRGAELLSHGQYVVTDRLHGHILCVLLGIPHVCMDNAYGKILSFFETWSETCPQAVYADSIETAIDKLKVLSSV